MGLGGISIWQLAIVLLIVVLIFGTKRLKSIGSDVGGAVKGFKRALDEESKDPVAPKRLDSDEPDAEFTEQKQDDKSRRS